MYWIQDGFFYEIVLLVNKLSVVPPIFYMLQYQDFESELYLLQDTPLSCKIAAVVFGQDQTVRRPKTGGCALASGFHHHKGKYRDARPFPSDVNLLPCFTLLVSSP